MSKVCMKIFPFIFLFLFFPIELSAATTAQFVTNGPVITGDFSDAGITNAINTYISKDRSVQGVMVGIQVRNRIVSLTGTMESAEEAALIVAVVESVPGVIDVDTSQLTIRGGNKLSQDELLTAKVKGSLIRQQAFSREITVHTLPITVSTNAGIVYLKGQVDSQSQLIYIVKIAQTVPGFPRVISELSVKPITVHN